MSKYDYYSSEDWDKEFIEDREEITAEQFKKATGFDPQDDDLERCNCPYAGNLMHSCCGWNKEKNKPQFLLGPKGKDN